MARFVSPCAALGCMNVTRVLRLIAVLSALAGAVIATGGYTAFHAIAMIMVDQFPLVLVIVGLAALIRAMAPPGSWFGPALLMAAGSLLLALHSGRFDGQWLKHVAAAALIWGGIFMTIVPGYSGSGHPAARDVRTYTKQVTAVVWPRNLRLSEAQLAQISGRAILGSLTIELTSEAVSSGTACVDACLSVLAGRIEIVVPSGWSVLPGRMGACSGVSFHGYFDEPDAGTAVGASGAAPAIVFVHVLGLGGVVSIARTA